jgi:hypothetical protein
MAAHRTFLAPGQRYTEPDAPAWRADRQVVVIHVGRDGHGVPRVTCRNGKGYQIVEAAAQFEAAISTGQLVPVLGVGEAARC